jgi:hypothetical protein
LTTDKEITTRVAPSILDYIGDVGGLNGIVFLVFSFFLSGYSMNRANAVLMNRLFHLTDTYAEGRQAIKDLEGDPIYMKNGEKDFSGIELIPPFFLGWKLWWHKFICYRFWPKSF